MLYRIFKLLDYNNLIKQIQEVILMNKLKLMHEVVTALKEKEACEGVLKVVGEKNEQSFLKFTKEFSKNKATGQASFKVSADVNCGEKKIKHESSTELQLPGCCDGSFKGLKNHFHGHIHPQKQNDCAQPHSQEPGCCFKSKLTMLGFFLKVLNEMEIEEKGKEGVLLLINLKEIPEDVQQFICQKMAAHHGGLEEANECCCLKELENLDKSSLKLSGKILIDSDKQIKKVNLELSGREKSESGVGAELKLAAELVLN